jgi:hypothetical protein
MRFFGKNQMADVNRVKGSAEDGNPITRRVYQWVKLMRRRMEGVDGMKLWSAVSWISMGRGRSCNLRRG